ncbi:hypothetical protein ACIBSW_12590 [Actinoplanes sp. NPDC049668]|uniref:hypothetical protein n=1 Tax=unclassified Actinoplanes TaxID=2626549 RepID=UPI0033A2386E
MTTEAGAGGRRLQPGHWLLIGIVVLLVGVAAFVVLRRGDADPTAADPGDTPSATAGTSTPPRADCEPQVTATGIDAAGVAYGFVYRSRCDQVVRELKFRVTALDADSNPIGGVTEGTASGGVLFPGGELAAAGELQNPTKAKVSGIQVTVTGYGAYPPGDFSGWTQPEVVSLAQSKPGAQGFTDITGLLRSTQPGVPVCIAEFVLIMRDTGDKILYTQAETTSEASRPTPSFSVPPVPGADLAHTTIYAPQRPRTATPPAAGVACDGS